MFKRIVCTSKAAYIFVIAAGTFTAAHRSYIEISLLALQTEAQTHTYTNWLISCIVDMRARPPGHHQFRSNVGLRVVF